MNIKSERLLGLIDGIYAIAITLFAIDLPKDLSALIQFEHGRELALLEYGIIYSATFFLIYDMWLVHKSMLMMKETPASGNLEIFTVLTLLIVTTIPGLALQGLDVFIEHKEGAQSDALSSYHLLMLGVYGAAYLCLSLVERTLGIRHTKSNIFMYSFGRALIFGAAFIVSIATYLLWSGYVLPVPVVVLVMVVSGVALRHSTDDNVAVM